MKTVNVSTILFLFIFVISNVHAQTTIPSASAIMKEAKAEAAKTDKNIFVIFHASWCIWCHRMDTAMNDETVKSFFDRNYVIRHLTVDESDNKKDLENPGAAALRTKYNGDKQGIPYWLILGKNGKLLTDSRLHDNEGKVTGNNIGCPAQPDEVNFFIRVLKKTSHLSDQDLQLIKTRFLKIAG